jgi:hypothetical protein
MISHRGITRSLFAAVMVVLAICPAAMAQYTQQGPKLVAAGAGLAATQGWSVALSTDGNTAAVGARGDNGVYVFVRSAGIWTQQGPKLVGTGAIGNAVQGTSVALSADGNTLLEGDPVDNPTGNYRIGAAWVFTRSGGVWTQQGSKLVGTGISTSGGGANQGTSVALSADGNTALVGGPADGSNYGASWVFTRSGGVWSQQAKLVGGAVGSNGSAQGTAVALSADGNTALVGGGPWVFTRSGGVWIQQGPPLVGSGGDAAGQGASVALSADGNTALDGNPFDNTYNGAAWVWTRSGGVWTQQGPKLVGAGVANQEPKQGSVALSADGNTALLGGPGDDGVYGIGAVWVFTRSGGIWNQSGSKLFGSDGVDPNQGASVAISGDASTLLWGGPVDNPQDTSSLGAAWVFVAGALIVAPGSLPFGHLSSGSSETLPVTIANNGTSAVSITSVNISGPNSSDFTSALNTCAGPLNGGTSCTLNMTFNARTTGNESALLTLNWSSGVMTQTGLTAGRAFTPPASPTPNDSAIGQATNLTAQWYFPPIGAQYQVFLGTSLGNLPLYATVTSPQTAFSNLNPGTQYLWQVVATVGNQTATGMVWPFTTAGTQSQAPDAVWPVNGATVDSTTLTLQWTSVSGASQYKVFFGSNVNNLPLYSTVNAPTVTAPVYNLNPGATYYWQIEAIVGGNTATSEKFAFTTPGASQKPNAVWPLNGVTVDSTTLNLEWTQISGASQYQVFFGSASTNLPLYATVNAPGVTSAVYNLNPGTTYYWQVAAIVGGSTATSAVFSFTTPGSQTFSPPGLVWPSNGSTGNATSLNVQWTAVMGATQYNVSFGTSSTNLTPYVTVAAPGVNAPFYNLNSGATYYWQVTAVDANGRTAAGPVWSFSTQ